MKKKSKTILQALLNNVDEMIEGEKQAKRKQCSNSKKERKKKVGSEASGVKSLEVTNLEIKPTSSTKVFRSSALPMLALFQEFKGRIRDVHIAKMKETPFGNLFLWFLLKEKWIKKKVRKLLGSWCKEKHKFKIGNKLVPLAPSDVAVTYQRKKIMK